MKRPAKIDGPDSRLALQLAFDGRRIPTVSLPSIVSGTFQGVAVGTSGGVVGARSDGGLRLEWALDPTQEGPEIGSRWPRNQPSEFALQAGVLRAEATSLASFGGGFGGDGAEASPEMVVLHAHHWIWETSGTPVLWVGSLPALDLDAGNCALRSNEPGGTRVTRACLRVQGHYTWTILTGSPNESVVLVSGSAQSRGALDRGILSRELTALAFALGQPLELRYLQGLDRELNVVAAMGTHLGGHPLRGSRSPVPVQIGDRAALVAQFFQRITTHMTLQETQETKGFRAALGGYLDGVSCHLDLGYLAAQVALEAFSCEIVGEDARKPVVQNSKAWTAWVKAHEREILGYAALGDSEQPDQEAAKVLLSRVHGAKNPSTSSLVKKALSRQGLAVPKSVLKEVEGRNTAAHEFWMSSPSKRDVQVDVRRLHTILTLLTALVARTVGYDGPIADHVRDSSGQPLVPGWWPISAVPQVEVRFLMERNL